MLLCKVSMEVGAQTQFWTLQAETGLKPALKVDSAPLFPPYILSDSLRIQLTYNEWQDYCPAVYRHCESHGGLYGKKDTGSWSSLNLLPLTVCSDQDLSERGTERHSVCSRFKLYSKYNNYIWCADARFRSESSVKKQVVFFFKDFYFLWVSHESSPLSTVCWLFSSCV